jgi:hypothetical protein
MLVLPPEVRMPTNAVLALDANFKTWQENRFPTPVKGINPFEYYCVEQFTRPYDLGDSQLKTGMIGGGQDGGIDGFYTLANSELVDSETELDPKDPPAFKLLMIQVKSDEGFSPHVIDKFYWFTDDLLDLAKGKVDYHSTYHADLIALMRLFKDKFGVVVGETPPLSVEYIYIIKKDVQPNADCKKSEDNLRKRVKRYFPHAQCSFTFVNAAALWRQVQARPPRKKTLKWASQPMSTQEGEIGVARLVDYYSFIKNDADGKIEERFFDSNVRGYWPTSGINKLITKTLDSADGPEFWLLNNGITILTDKTSTTANYLEVELHDPQIVNGLQTSRTIYNHFAGMPPKKDDNRRLVIRVIRTTDGTVRDNIIRCTNSQNTMPDEALRATDEIHRMLEVSFQTQNLYYDRRKGHYREKGKPVAQIVSVIEVMQAMLSIVLKRPDEARARPRDYVRKNDLYNSVFGNDKFSLTLYLRTTEISRRVTSFLEENESDGIHRRNLNFYLCMYASCVKIGSAYAIPNQIAKIDLATLTDDFLRDCYKRIMKPYERLAQKQLKEGGDRDYDSVSKGPLLLKKVDTDLKRRFRSG